MEQITKALQTQEDLIQPFLMPMEYTHTKAKKIKLYQFSFSVVSYLCLQ